MIRIRLNNPADDAATQAIVMRILARHFPDYDADQVPYRLGGDTHWTLDLHNDWWAQVEYLDPRVVKIWSRRTQPVIEAFANWVCARGRNWEVVRDEPARPPAPSEPAVSASLLVTPSDWVEAAATAFYESGAQGEADVRMEDWTERWLAARRRDAEGNPMPWNAGEVARG